MHIFEYWVCDSCAMAVLRCFPCHFACVCVFDIIWCFCANKFIENEWSILIPHWSIQLQYFFWLSLDFHMPSVLYRLCYVIFSRYLYFTKFLLFFHSTLFSLDFHATISHKNIHRKCIVVRSVCLHVALR